MFAQIHSSTKNELLWVLLSLASAMEIADALLLKPLYHKPFIPQY
jgi:hypothetical protein